MSKCHIVGNHISRLIFYIPANDDDTYILTTDADVRFTPDAVEALLDLMTRDPSVGAVCARTHPLGSGPMVWYQVFEYAIGHWFQKVINLTSARTKLF